MNALTRYRLKYVLTLEKDGPQVYLSEILKAEDLDDAMELAQSWAQKRGWTLKAVEELENHD